MHCDISEESQEAAEQSMAERQQYLYVLRPVERLLVAEHWTEKEAAITGRHFARLEGMLAQGRLILAGKTEGLDESTFGIVIFEADSPEEAIEIMNSDPGVAEGIMTAQLFPYRVALSRS